MVPKVIIHNSISADGSLTHFQPNMELHYQIASGYSPNAHLIGSNTIKAGIELYSEGIPPEEERDFEKPERMKNLPYWVIPDTKGKLQGLLHICRRFQFCRNVVVLISETTPKQYEEYLRGRSYTFHVVGKQHIDLRKSLELLSAEYEVKSVLADTGRILGNLLIEQNLASEISLLVHPEIVGKNSYNVFGNIRQSVDLKLRKSTSFSGGYVWLVYGISKKKSRQKE